MFLFLKKTRRKNDTIKKRIHIRCRRNYFVVFNNLVNYKNNFTHKGVKTEFVLNQKILSKIFKQIIHKNSAIFYLIFYTHNQNQLVAMLQKYIQKLPDRRF